MNKLLLLSLFFLLFLSEKGLGQETIDTPIEHYIVYKQPKDYVTFSVSGRIIGMNLENVQGVIVTNKRTATKTNSDSRGVYQVSAAKGDTLTFEVAKYSREQYIVKSPKENGNIIMIKRKTDNLSPGSLQSDYDKAHRDDEELMRILQKDAKLEGKWNY